MAGEFDDDGEQTVSINEYLESIEEEELVTACPPSLSVRVCFTGIVQFSLAFWLVPVRGHFFLSLFGIRNEKLKSLSFPEQNFGLGHI